MDRSKAARAALMLARPKRDLGGGLPYSTGAAPAMPSTPSMLGGPFKVRGGMSAPRGGGGGDSPFGGGIPGLNDGGGGEGAGGNGSGNSAAGSNAAAGTGAAATGDSGTGTAGDGDGQKRGGRIRRADGGAVDEPPPENGLYSQAARIVANLPQAKASPAQYKATLLKQGVKPDELKWSGYDEKIGTKPVVTKAELAQHFNSNLPNVQETVLGEQDMVAPGGRSRMSSNPAKFRDYQLPGGQNYREVLLHLPPTSSEEAAQLKTAHATALQRRRDAAQAKVRLAAEHNQARSPESQRAYAQALIEHEEATDGLRDAEQKMWKARDRDSYKSSHWDQPNVLAHLRMSDREGPNGEKILHLEEMQSDWAQAGRKSGFADGTPRPVPHEIREINFEGRPAYGVFVDGRRRMAYYDRAQAEQYASELTTPAERDGVPHAPYVDSTAKWTDLGLKRALKEAAKGGYDKLVITPGDEQAKRYDLSKQVDSIYTTSRPSKPGHVELAVRPKGQNDYHEVGGDSVPFEELDKHVGKDLAEKIIADHKAADPARGAHNRTYEGLDLKVGGEGMKGYYDKILPTALQKLAKKHDPSAEVKLHEHPIKGIEPDMDAVADNDVRDHHDLSARTWDRMTRSERADYRMEYIRDQARTAKVHSLDITPKMRASILRGHAAYATGGSVRPTLADGGTPPDPTVARAMAVVPDSHPVVAQAQQILKTQTPKPVKQDPMSAVHALSATPQDQAEQVMQQNADRGLIFPQDASANRLRMKLARHKKAAEKGEDLPGMPTNPRTVIKAPEGLPDFVAGRVTPQDWVSRHEQLLSPEEIQNSADWYKRVYGTFLQQTKGDEEQAKKYMRGWLVAQQNVDVSGAMNNVLLQNEQMKRGVPEDQMRAAGMPNPTAAARSVLADKPITGVGQKISDFVDAAEGKDVRSWMANHPDGGKPFVVDVHTGRDTGLVDQELINHLTRLGYDPKAIKKLKVDMHASPSETQYENRAHFGHEITDHLNNIGWQGRQDWTPSEVQAVGWMGMTKLTANQADDVVSGLDRNTRRLSMELAPGEGSPWHKKYGEAFSGLKPEDQYELTHHMTQKAIEHASKLAGIDVRDIVHGTGGWQQYQNPSTVGQALATKEGAEIAANALGHLLQQTEVWSNSVKPVTANPKGFAVDFIADGDHNLHTDEGLRDFWGKIMEADPLKGTPKALFQGYQPIRTVDGKVGIRALIDRGGAGTKKVLHDAVEGPIRTMVEGLPFDVHAKMHEAEIMKARNDWNEDKHGQAYKSRLVDLLKRDPSAELGRAGQELEEEFQAKLREKGAKIAGGAKLQKAAGGAVHRDPYRHARKVVATTGRYASGGAVDHNPSDAQKTAGNYAKRKISFQGIPISIENALGSVRSGTDRNGKAWSCKLPADYGYIRGTEGADGDHVDAYIGPSADSNLVVVINQCELDGRFDEHKCLVGFDTEKAAIDCYCKAFSDGKGADRIKSIEVMSVDAFKQWLKSGKTTRPANGRSIVDRALQLTSKGAQS